MKSLSQLVSNVFKSFVSYSAFLFSFLQLLSFQSLVLLTIVYMGVKTQEFLVLGGQTLTELRDKIYCLTDQMMRKAGQHDPSGYFLIEVSYICSFLFFMIKVVPFCHFTTKMVPLCRMFFAMI